MADYKLEEELKKRKESNLWSWHQWRTNTRSKTPGHLSTFLPILLKKQYNQNGELNEQKYYLMKTQTLQH